MGAVSKEQAQIEVTDWLDSKRVKAKKREKQKDTIETLVEAIEEGDLIFDQDTKVMTMKLAFGIGKDDNIKELNFKPRANVGEVNSYLKKVKTDDADGRLLCYVYALTGQPAAVIDCLDTEDYALALSIAIFFM